MAWCKKLIQDIVPGDVVYDSIAARTHQVLSGGLIVWMSRGDLKETTAPRRHYYGMLKAERLVQTWMWEGEGYMVWTDD